MHALDNGYAHTPRRTYSSCYSGALPREAKTHSLSVFYLGIYYICDLLTHGKMACAQPLYRFFTDLATSHSPVLLPFRAAVLFI